MKKITKNCNIFLKTYLIIPIFEFEHWTLVIVIYPQAILNYIITMQGKYKNTKIEDSQIKIKNDHYSKTIIYYFDSLTSF